MQENMGSDARGALAVYLSEAAQLLGSNVNREEGETFQEFHQSYLNDVPRHIKPWIERAATLLHERISEIVNIKHRNIFKAELKLHANGPKLYTGR